MRRILAGAVALVTSFAEDICAESNLFFTDRGARLVRRANFDGSGIRTIVTGETTSNLRGIALDVPEDLLFYADNGADIIYRTDLEGGSRVALINNGRGFPADVAIDPVNRMLYWCDRDNDRIERAGYDGGGRETVILTESPYFLELDLASGKIYWGDFSGGNIFRADLADGGNMENVVSGLVQTRGVKIDSAGGYLYWCDRNASKVQRRPISGGGIEDLYSGLDTPHGLTLDPGAGKLYWADTGTNRVPGSFGPKAVNRGDMDGSSPPEVVAEVNQPWDLELDRRATRYETWVGSRFRMGAATFETARTADPDGDSLTNILEYFFLRDPLAADASAPAAPATLEQMLGVMVPALAYRRRAMASDVTDSVEVSADLTTWQRGATVTTPPSVEPDGPEAERVTVGILRDGAAVSSRVSVEW